MVRRFPLFLFLSMEIRNFSEISLDESKDDLLIFSSLCPMLNNWIFVTNERDDRGKIGKYRDEIAGATE